MKIDTYENEIPDYALCYLINDDPSGLDDDEIKTIDNFMEEFYQEAERLGGHVVIDVIDWEGSFNPFPAFGLACNTLKCNSNILY